MTDKEQIIINGVNVSGCKCYNKNIKTDCLLYPLQPDACKNNPNCHFKQLARKTQELETICKAFDIEYGYDEETGATVGRCNKLIEKEKELEKYKQSLDEKNKFLQDLGISASGEFKRIKFYIENLKNKYGEKVKECEELKGKLRKLELKNTTLQNRNQQLNGSMAKADCYREALEEIEAAIETYSSKHQYSIANDLYNQILDIINKAKEQE